MEKKVHTSTADVIKGCAERYAARKVLWQKYAPVSIGEYDKLHRATIGAYTMEMGRIMQAAQQYEPGSSQHKQCIEVMNRMAEMRSKMVEARAKELSVGVGGIAPLGQSLVMAAVEYGAGISLSKGLMPFQQKAPGVPRL